MIKKYLTIGLSVIVLMSFFVYYTDENNIDYDHTGIIHNVRSSSSGFTFNIDTSDSDFRCFFKEKPDDLGYYALKGSFSDDGSMFFVEIMTNIDINRNQD